MIISVSIKQEAYTNNTAGHCWLSSADGLVWAFLVPVFVVLILNTIILTSSAIRIGTARKNLAKIKQVRVALISAFILTPVLGMPWVISFAKIITVGIQDALALRIIDTFIDWVFVCLNAPAGVIFFIIVFKRFKEHRKSLTVDKTRKEEQSTSGFAKFRKTNQATAETSFAHSTTMVGCEIHKTPSDASVYSKTDIDNTSGLRNFRTASAPRPRPRPRRPQDKESLFDKNDPIGIYSTIHHEYTTEFKQKKSFEMTTISNPIYEVTSLQDLSKLSSNKEDGIELGTLVERKLSSSCQFNYDNPYDTSQQDDEVRLTQSGDEIDESKDASILSRGIDFLKNSFKLSDRGRAIDTEVGNKETTTDSDNDKMESVCSNKYLQHLHYLAERTQSNPEISQEPTTESQTVDPLRIRRKSSPCVKRQSCEPVIKVMELKEYFDESPKRIKSPLSTNLSHYSSITEGEEDSRIKKTETTSTNVSSLEQSISPITDLSRLIGNEERVKESNELCEDNVFKSPKKTETSLFQFQLNKSPRKKLHLQKSNSLGHIDQDDMYGEPLQRRSTELASELNPASNVSHRVKCFENIIERSMSDADDKPQPSRKAHSIGSANLVTVAFPISNKNPDSTKSIGASSLGFLDILHTEDSPKHGSDEFSPHAEK